MASGRPGKPAPVPMSATAAAAQVGLQTKAVEDMFAQHPNRCGLPSD